MFLSFKNLFSGIGNVFQFIMNSKDKINFQKHYLDLGKLIKYD